VTREVFIAHVEREQEALRGFLLALCCGKKDDADDLAQDSLVKAYLSSAGYQDKAASEREKSQTCLSSSEREQARPKVKGKFRSWLFKIAYNTFLNHKASLRCTESIDEARALVSSTRADSEFEHQDLYLALRTLPPKERSAITLFYLSGYSVREIATITDTLEDAVKKQLSRGRDKLREQLKMEQ